MPSVGMPRSNYSFAICGDAASYTLFGPWESDPSKNILNFKAPLGQAIYNMEAGETKKFNINGIDYDYTVKTIELANF